MENIETKNLAERLAVFLQENEKETSDSTFLRAGFERISRRLDALETKLDAQSSNNIEPSAFSFQSSNHPSQHKFSILEAINDTAYELHETEKPCPYEPTGKLCDHCSMCNSRGF